MWGVTGNYLIASKWRGCEEDFFYVVVFYKPIASLEKLFLAKFKLPSGRCVHLYWVPEQLDYPNNLWILLRSVDAAGCWHPCNIWRSANVSVKSKNSWAGLLKERMWERAVGERWGIKTSKASSFSQQLIPGLIKQAPRQEEWAECCPNLSSELHSSWLEPELVV